mgnify:FL=1
MAIRLMDRTDLTFPANDGGLFYSMIRDLQANAFRLPQYASYNGGSIPFAYPPLGFYLAGALDVTMPVSLEALLAYLPLAINLFVGLAAYSLAWELFGSRWTALASAAAWYLLPDSARFLVMGGGLTRSLGLLWAVLAIHSAHRMYARGSARDALATAALSALALATHLEMAWFAAWAIASLALVKVRSWRTAALSAGAALGALALSTPWWGTVIARHGPDVFLGTLSGSAGEWPWTYALSVLMRGGMHNELLPVISVIGLCGAVLAVHRRQYWLPIWLLVVF